jgi:hypothetical protein
VVVVKKTLIEPPHRVEERQRDGFIGKGFFLFFFAVLGKVRIFFFFKRLLSFKSEGKGKKKKNKQKKNNFSLMILYIIYIFLLSFVYLFFFFFYHRCGAATGVTAGRVSG